MVPVVRRPLTAVGRCWNCGRPGLPVAGRAYHVQRCLCGCEWSVGTPPAGELLARREELLAGQWEVEMVDFTRPGAPGAPA